MKKAFALAIVLLGAATLFADPEEEPDFTLGLAEAFGVAEDQADVLMKALGQESPRQLRVDATFLRVAAAEADPVLGEHRPDELGSVRPIPRALARRLIEGARGKSAIRPEPLPPLLLYDGQRGRLSATGHHTYLQDYDVEVGQNRFAYVPMVGLMKDGVRLDVTPSADGERIALDVDAVWAEAVRPIPRFVASLRHRTGPVRIELPEMRLIEVKKPAALPAEGGYLLAGGGRAWDGESLRLVVIEVRAAKR